MVDSVVWNVSAMKILDHCAVWREVTWWPLRLMMITWWALIAVAMLIMTLALLGVPRPR